jgi:outer membrane protein TolC
MLGGLLLLAGCAVGPDYQRSSPAPAPAAWKAGSPWKAGQPRDAQIKQRFWEIFANPILAGLGQAATTNSPDVAAAFERVEQARALAPSPGPHAETTSPSPRGRGLG